MKRVGLRIVQTLVGLQGPQSQWAWFYRVPTGRVADFYPVYSVHQHAMAHFFLFEATNQGYSEFKKPMVKGFQWALGNNELNKSIVDHTHNLIWRSVARR